MSFKDQIKVDFLNIFANSNEFAESISFTPYGGSAKTIKAVIQRGQISPASEDNGRTLLNDVQIYIPNDATYGVASITKGADTAMIPLTDGGATAKFVVGDILGNDNGMWHLLMRK